MQDVALPLLWGLDTPVSQALQVLLDRKAGGAVIREAPDDLRLVSIGQVRLARWRNIETLRGIENLERIVRPTLAQLSEHQLDLVEPSATSQNYETYLDSVSQRFGVIAATYHTAIIFSRHEGYMADYDQGPSDCYCTNEGHTQPPPPGRSCPKCGGDIRCDQ